ncbi:hypothetical protein ABIB42_001076 [Massilia sp. UYP32]|uniref:hypothetical protein n=1 Tax=Massilia sp. UYP32 TaxID=1756386 RepID=UPI003D24E47E
MIKDNAEGRRLPQNPGQPNKEGPVSSAEESDYYVRTAVQAATLKYAGRGKGKEILLSEGLYRDFLKLQAIFGKDFGLNEVICAAYYFVKENQLPLHVDHSESGAKKITFKPSEEALYAIAKSKIPDAFDNLIRIGLFELCCRLK